MVQIPVAQTMRTVNLPQDGRSKPRRPAFVDLHNVVKIYEGAAGRYTALKGINFRVDPGEFLAVVGKSGSGKSTLMNMVTGIDRPTAGEVTIGGLPIYKLSEGQMAKWRGTNVGVVFQFFQLLPTLTVIENVMLPMDFCHKYPLRQRKERAYHLLDQVELGDQAAKLPSALSGGQQQRVAIARALANDPPMLVADEPTGNLDSKTAQSIFDLFEHLVQQGKTIIMVTHDQDVVKRVARTIFLMDGRIVGDQLKEPAATAAQPEPVQTEAPQSEAVPVEAEIVDGVDIPQVRQRIRAILNSPSQAVPRLRQELINAPRDKQAREVIYKIILDEVSYRAEKAESAGQFDEARNYWKILVDASNV